MTNYNNEMKLHTLNQLAHCLEIVGDKLNILDMLILAKMVAWISTIRLRLLVAI
jgi:hypothetical protein